MIALNADTKIWLCTRDTDMRRSFDGLSAQVKKQMEENPQSGALFVFINKRRTQMKCLYFEPDGYCVWSKRLEQGQFALSRQAASNKRSLSKTDFLSLLEGVDFKVIRQRKRYKNAQPPANACYNPRKENTVSGHHDSR